MKKLAPINNVKREKPKSEDDEGIQLIPGWEVCSSNSTHSIFKNNDLFIHHAFDTLCTYEPVVLWA